MKATSPIVFGLVVLSCVGSGLGQEERKSSCAPVVPKEIAAVMTKQKNLIAELYDLKNDPTPNVTMAGGKLVRRGVRAKLASGTTWEKLAAMTPEETAIQRMNPVP